MQIRPTPWLAIAVGGVMAVGCHPLPRVDAPPEGTASADSIVLERTLCYGTCPAYRLRITGPGLVAFESLNPGDSGRVASDRITPQAVRALVAEADRLGFDTLPEIIDRDRRFCPDKATDHPTATVTVFRQARAKRVEDYHGCFARSDHSVTDLVTRLRLFEKSIDDTTRSTRWVQPANRR